MADQIKHGSTEIVNSTAKVVDGALPSVANSGNDAGTYVSNTTQRIASITVDTKGRITAISNTAASAGKSTGVDFKVAGNTLTDVTVFVSTSAPGSGDGADGDVWYQVTS
jgi:hypothetical protein